MKGEDCCLELSKWILKYHSYKETEPEVEFSLLLEFFIFNLPSFCK